MKQFDAILFDLDGTLWDSVEGVIHTWNRVIARYPGLREPISRQEQESLMGLQMDEISRRLFPRCSSDMQLQLITECAEEENQYLSEVGGILYPDIPVVLQKLSEQYQLCIVSNCQKGYIEAFFQAHGLKALFTDYICFGDTGKRKGESMLALIQRNGYKSPIYVGDTQGDCDEAHYAGLPFIFADYGMGNASGYEARISSPIELLSLI